MAAFLGALGATTSIPSHRSKPTQPARLRVNGERLQRHLSELAEFGRNPYGGVSRLAYSESDRAGRDYVMRLMQRAELDVTIDYGGNIVGRRAGSVSGLPPVMAGSHIDSVPDGGNYDGTVGVLAAIEVAQTLAEAGMVTRHPLEVVVFQNEEGGTVGSRAMIGDLHDRDLDSVARSGKSWRDGIRFLGGVPERLDRPLRQRGDVAAYVELHIEQSGTLEREGIQIGIVEGIVGIGWWDVTVDGFANHAGTTPMNDRRDALLAAARFVEAVNWVAKSEPGRHVATVGRIQASFLAGCRRASRSATWTARRSPGSSSA
jgi:N-carbamoyl-L-amino-acid hydrolase